MVPPSQPPLSQDLAEARTALRTQRPARAAELCLALLAQLPGEVEALEVLAAAWLALDRPEAAEQGFGDSLQFLRYVPLLAERGAEVLLRLPPALASLAAATPKTGLLRCAHHDAHDFGCRRSVPSDGPAPRRSSAPPGFTTGRTASARSSD
jgi:hypothetical protein